VVQDLTKKQARNRKVLFLTPFYDNTCGVGTAAKGLSEALRERGNQVDVLVYAPWREGGNNKYQLISSDEKSTINFGNSQKLLEYLRANNLNYDVLHSHNQIFSNSESEDIMKHFRHIPILTQIHMGVPYANDILKDSSPHGEAELLRQARMLARSDKVIHLSEDMGDLMKEYYGSEHPENSGVIYNFAKNPITDPTRVDYLKKRLAPNGEKLLLYAGRMSEEKGIHELLLGFKEAKAVDPRLKLVICGSDPHDYKFASQLNEATKGLKEGRDYVKVGKVSQEDLQNYYAASDFFIQPSRFEHFSISLIEAMAHKKPIIMTKVPSMRKVMKLDDLESNQYAIPIEELNSPRAIAEAILKTTNMAKTDLESLVDRAHGFFKAELTPEVIAKKYEQEYDALIASKRKVNCFENVYAIPFSNSDTGLGKVSEASLSRTISSILSKDDESQIIISPYGTYHLSRKFLADYGPLIKTGRLRILAADERITKKKSHALNKSFSESSKVGATFITFVIPGQELGVSYRNKIKKLREADMVYSNGAEEEDLEARLKPDGEGTNPINQSETTFWHSSLNAVGAHWDNLTYAEDMDLYQKMLKKGMVIKKHNGGQDEK